jgi:CsoR family transcriptional regulator, copper-sensing transcriptional repressor
MSDTIENEVHDKPIIDRINRIEGQVRGIRRMVEERRGCHDVIKQVAATAGALRSLGLVMMEHHLKDCVNDAVEGKMDRDVLVRQLLDVFNRVSV